MADMGKLGSLLGRRTTGKPSKGWPSRALSSLWNRGATEAALLVTAAAVASGVIFGAGVARATSQTSDGQTWAATGNGSIVQINPVTGEPVSEVAIGVDGPVVMQQGGSVVLVTSPSTGQTVSIDVSKVAASQTRTDDPDSTKPLLAGDITYIAELDSGVVRVVDTRTLADIGEAYVAPSTLVDVVVDKTNTLWVLGTDSSLTPLHFDRELSRFVLDRDPVEVQGVAASSRMVPHDTGVTVLVPSSHYLVQFGTGADVQIVDPQGLLAGEVIPAGSSPRDLVAASLDGRVLILSGDRLTFVETDAETCDDPGRPAVFGERVYVPCQGKGRTVVLDRDGASAREDIVTGTDDDPQIVVDDDSLVVTSSDAEKVVTVDPQGNEHITQLAEKTVPVRTPAPATTKAKKADAGGSSSAAVSTEPTEPTEPTASSERSSSEPPTSDPELPPEQSRQEQPSLPSTPWQTQPQQSSPEIPDRNQQPTTESRTADSSNPTSVSNSSNRQVVQTSSGPVPGTTTTTGGGRQPQGGHDGPRGVRAAVVGSGVVQVSWTAPERTPSGYRVQTTDGSGGTEVSSGQTSATVTLSQRDGTVRFVVVANFDDAGSVKSRQSNSVDLGSAAPTSSSDTVTTSSNDPVTTSDPVTASDPVTGSETVANSDPATDGAPVTSSDASTSESEPSDPSTVAVECTDGAQPVDGACPVVTTPETTTTQPPPPVTTTSEEPPPPATTTTSEEPPPPPPATTTSEEPPPPPPATTTSEEPPPPPPATTTSEEPPPPPPATTTTEEAPPPAAPQTPSGLDAGNDGMNGISVVWDAQTSDTTYTVTYTVNSGAPISQEVSENSDSKRYGGFMQGTVTISVVAHLNGQTSAAATTSAVLMRDDMCPGYPLQAGGWEQGVPGQQQGRPMCDPCPESPYECQIPLHRGGWQAGDVVGTATAEPVNNPLGRYGSAAGLLALAGLIRWGRKRNGAHDARHLTAAAGPDPQAGTADGDPDSDSTTDREQS